MPSDPSFDRRYIREFANVVRRRTPAAYGDRVRRVRQALSEISHLEKKSEALDRLARIRNYSFNYIEDTNGNEEFVAAECDELADFVSALN